MPTFSASGSSAGASWKASAWTFVRGWTIDITQAVAQGSHSSSAGYVESYPGVMSWTASVTFYQGETIQAIEGLETAGQRSGDLVLTDGSANTYSGAAVITGVSYENDIEGGGLVSGTVNLVGHGALAVTEVNA